jgi:hypothetical protein
MKFREWAQKINRCGKTENYLTVMVCYDEWTSIKHSGQK